MDNKKFPIIISRLIIFRQSRLYFHFIQCLFDFSFLLWLEILSLPVIQINIGNLPLSLRFFTRVKSLFITFVVYIQYECQLHIPLIFFILPSLSRSDELIFFSFMKGLSCGELLCNTTLILKLVFCLSQWTAPPLFFSLTYLVFLTRFACSFVYGCILPDDFYFVNTFL